MKFEATYYLNLLDDETNVELARVRDDPARIRERLDTNPDVLTYDFVQGDHRGVVYIHSQASTLVNDLLEILLRHEIVVDWPMEYTEQGGIRITILGEDKRIRGVFEEIPDELHVIFERIGDYESDMR